MMIRLTHLAACILVMAVVTGCSKSEDANGTQAADTQPDEHIHDDGRTHDDDHDDAGHGLSHDEIELGTVTIDDLDVDLAQGHGAVEAGKEEHLVVKLPYSDDGATIVRAWIGVEDRTLSIVGLGEYAPSHDDYDIHAMAPDPLPDDAQWWIEIEKPDGTKVVGSTPVLTNLEQ